MPHSNGDNVLHVTPIKVQMNSGLKRFRLYKYIYI